MHLFVRCLISHSYNSCLRSLCEVWPGAIEHANLVEPSEAMSFARRSLFQGDLFILLFTIEF